jgi:hypothetical protein
VDKKVEQSKEPLMGKDGKEEAKVEGEQPEQ